MKKTKLVSVHGGHSGQFCNHGRDTLQEMIARYVELGFDWVGITEHVYPSSESHRYPDEVEAGITAKELEERFNRYIRLCRELQESYRDRIRLMVAFEIECCTGYGEFIPSVIEKSRPDYVVGSVHHVDDMCIDYSKELYMEAAGSLGGVDNLYCRYFDIQYEMIEALTPAVVGHFDLVRIFDEDYRKRIKKPEIYSRIIRNLDLISKRDIIMDFNLRALMKGAFEPYISLEILREARRMGIAVVPGDDSHGVGDIGVNMELGVSILRSEGFETDWRSPALYNW